MKKLMKLSVKILVIIGLMTFFSCSKSHLSDMTDSVTGNDMNTSAKVLDDIHYTLLKVERSTYFYKSSQAGDFKVGNFLVHHEWPQIHMLRKITAVNQIDGDTVSVSTTEATFEEVIPDTKGMGEVTQAVEICEYIQVEDGSIQIQSELPKKIVGDIAAGKVTKATLQGTLAKEIAFNLFAPKTLYQSSNANITLTGNAVVKPSVSVKLETSWLKLQSFEVNGSADFSFKTVLDANATAALSKNFAYAVVPKVSKVYLFMLGALPVYFTLTVEAQATSNIAFNGSAKGTLTLDGAYNYTYGVSWTKSGGWKHTGGTLNTLKAIGVTPSWAINANASATAGVKGITSLYIYDVFGPKLTAEPYVKATATLANTIVNWNLTRGFKADFRIGVSDSQALIPTSIFGINLYWQKTLIDSQALISQGSYNLLSLAK